MRKIYFILWLFVAAIIFSLALTPNLINPPNEADKVMHVIAFCLMMLYPVCTWKSVKSIIALGIFLILAGIGIEILQLLIGGRKSSALDAAADAAGVILGLVIGWLLRSGYNAPYQGPAFSADDKDP